MITEKSGNLLEASDINAIAHVCNLYCTFGAGFALHLKNKYPEAYAADLKTKNGDQSKLGKCSVGSKGKLRFYNMYCMTGMGTHKRQVNYEYLIECLERVCANMIDLKKKTLGVPSGMGAGLAGGNWGVIRAIIESVFDNSGVDVIIYKI